MSSDSVCRVCLVNNLNLYGVRNYLQNVYETITREKYNEVGYPVRMCYICLSALRKCHRFMETALDANTSLKQFYNQQCQMVLAKPLSIYSVTKVESVSIDSEGITCDVKIEKADSEEESDVEIQTDNFEVSCEDIEIEVKPVIEINDETQLSQANEIPKELNTELKIEEPHEKDAGTFVFETLKPKSKVFKSKNTNKGKGLHICDICNESCTSACTLKRHITLKHSPVRKNKLNIKPKTYSCTECTFKCTKKVMFNRHLKIHTGEKYYSCNMCSFKSRYSSNLTTHMKTHTGEKPYLCNICSNRFAQKSHLTRHMNLHTGTKSLSCNICHKNFPLRDYLITHMKVHGEKSYACNICNYKTGLKSNLISHTKLHTGDKPFICTFCDFKSNSKFGLKLHMKTHTGDKQFSCDKCSQSYIQKKDLTVHMRTHTGEKPFSCNICNYKCARKALLTRHHITNHTSEKPFSCQICSFKSALKVSLNRHMKRHSGDKPK